MRLTVAWWWWWWVLKSTPSDPDQFTGCMFVALCWCKSGLITDRDLVCINIYIFILALIPYDGGVHCFVEDRYA